jgi:hypothetical protein
MNTTPTPPPLSRELDAFLAPHRTVSPLPPSVAARAMARAAATVEWSRPPAHHATLAAPRRWVFAATASAVVVAGAAAYAARAWIVAPSPAAPAPTLPTPVSARGGALAPTAAAAQTEASDLRTTLASETPSRRRLAGRVTAAPLRTSRAELQLLRTARQDVTNGEYAEALAVIGEHSRRFRNGGLVEEREALRVKSLAGLGRWDEAQRAAAELQARFPRSVFLPTFERIAGKSTGAVR